MIFLLIALLFPAPIFLKIIDDPAPGISQTKAESRNLDCKRLSREQAHERFPGKVPEAPPRGAFFETDAMVCERRITSLGERLPGHEAILTDLSGTAAGIAENVAAIYPDNSGTWLVEPYFPDAAVASKISFAVKAALVERGRKVSDRAPILSSDDVLILAKMPPMQAYPTACKRYAAENSIGDDTKLLSVMQLDERETQLHAGVCEQGRWRWLR